MATSSRLGKVTDEHREEARRLRAIWARTADVRKAAGCGTQEAFGQKFEIGNQAAVGFFLNAKTALSAKAAIGFARGLGCSIEEFSPRLARQAAEFTQAARTTTAFEDRALEVFRMLDSESAQQRLLDFAAGLAAATRTSRL